MKILLIYILIMGAGIALGYKTGFSSKSRSRDLFQKGCLLVILFLLGHQLGANEEVASSMTSMGLTGLLLCLEQPAPLRFGGTGSRSEDRRMPEELPDRLEAGTLNVPGIAGLGAGLRWLLARDPSALRRNETALLRRAARGLEGLGARVWTGPGQTGVLSFRLPGRDCETAASAYAARGIALRAGLHCAPLAHRTGGTLPEGTLRLSVSPLTRESEIEGFLSVSVALIRKK